MKKIFLVLLIIVQLQASDITPTVFNNYSEAQSFIEKQLEILKEVDGCFSDIRELLNDKNNNTPIEDKIKKSVTINSLKENLTGYFVYVSSVSKINTDFEGMNQNSIENTFIISNLIISNLNLINLNISHLENMIIFLNSYEDFKGESKEVYERVNELDNILDEYLFELKQQN